MLIGKVLENSIDGVVEALLEIDLAKKATVRKLAHVVEAKSRDLTVLPSKYDIINMSSVLYPKDYKHLANFSWGPILKELVDKFPTVTQMLMAMALPSGLLGNTASLVKLAPKLGLVYAIMMQNRDINFSKVQRVLSLVLCDQHTSQKVVGYEEY